jgi:UDP-perosamine 4-acetyltransferase
MTSELVIVGAGGHAKVAISTAREAGWNVKAVYDDDSAKLGSNLLGVPVVGDIAAASSSKVRGIIAIGNNKKRSQISEQLALEWATLIHPRAYVHDSVVLGAGTVVFAGAIIQPDAVIGDHCILNTGCSIDHDCRIGSFVHIAPGTRLAGEVSLGDGVLMGIGSAALPQTNVGGWSTVGAGSTVTTTLGPNITAVGSPAKRLR